jgi:cathepsin B
MNSPCFLVCFAALFLQNRGFASSIYQISSDTTAIQTEIMQHGPVTAHMLAYDDLSAYQSGIYRHTYGALDGGHFVRIVGWGTYLDSSCNCNHVAWLVFNSWGPDWGMSGAFWIWEHDSSIGDEIDAGIP